jgi:hypothetical protein
MCPSNTKKEIKKPKLWQSSGMAQRPEATMVILYHPLFQGITKSGLNESLPLRQTLK